MSGHILELSQNVERKKVEYRNRYGLEITGELYLKKGISPEQKRPALIIGAPYGGVKEQGPCVYGNELAQKGFVVLTFDQSFMGESGGFPRNVSSPDIFVENFSAAVCGQGKERCDQYRWFRFYALKRGHHPNARGGFTTTSELAIMDFRPLDFIDEISPVRFCL